MMSQQKNPFAELVALTELYLLQNYSLQERVMVCRESYDFFVDYAQKARWSPTPEKQIPAQQMSQISLPPSDQKKEPTTPPSPPSPKKEQTTTSPLPTPPPTAPEPMDAITLHPPPPPSDIDQFTDFRHIFSKKFPSVRVLETPPRETTIEVGILALQPTQQERLLLSNLATSITVSYCPASLISVESLELSSDLRLVIAAENVDDKQINKHSIAVVRMLPLSQYLNNPLLKAELWKTIDHHLSQDG